MSGQSPVVRHKTSFRDLSVWRKSIELAKHIYHATEEFPKREHFGLAAQIRKSAVSIASNIAEGASRQTNKDYLHFLIIARGSLNELRTQLEIAMEVGYVSPETHGPIEAQCDEISRMLHGLRTHLTTND